MKHLRSIGLVVAVGCALAPACKKKEAEKQSSSAPAPGTSPAAAPGAGPSSRGDAPLTLPKGIPATAVMVGAWEAPENWIEKVAGMGIVDAAVTRAALADADAYLTKTTGLSLTKVHKAAFFVTAEGKPAALIAKVDGTWKVPTPPSAKVVMHDGWMVIGEPSAVDLAIATAKGEKPGLAADSVLAKLFERESKGALIAGAVDVTKLPADVRDKAAAFGVERGAFAIGAQVRVLAEGKSAGLATLVQMFETQTASVMQMLDMQRGAALSNASPDRGPRGEELGMIVGSHYARAAIQLVRPKLEGDSLRVAIDMPFEAAMAVPMIGILSAVAVPAFMSYMRKAEAAEAEAAPATP